MNKRTKPLVAVTLVIALTLLAGCVRKFTITPQMKSYDFTVVEKFGKLSYVTCTDTRSQLDKKGQSPSRCLFSSKAGVTVLGDKNYKNQLIPEFDKHMKKALTESALFATILEGESPEADYIFKGNLEQFNVVLDESKAQQTQACLGDGLIGAAVASSVDVQATTEIRITGILTKGSEEVWRQSVSKQVLKIDNYSATQKNTENSMGEAIGEGCKELVTAMATYLASK